MTPVSPTPPTAATIAEWQQELAELLGLFPPRIVDAVRAAVTDPLNLVDVSILAGRKPMITVNTSDAYLPVDVASVTQAEVDAVTAHRHFDRNSRAALPGLLHRIYAHVGADDHVIYGVTARVGRAMPGAAEVIRDVLTTPTTDGRLPSVLLAGPAGVGKSTLLRDVARLLSAQYRTVVVDKSGELGGESHVPHHALGENVFRLEMDEPELQYRKMREALQNLTPKVILVDEIGNADEVFAARDIAQSGVSLVATTHAQTMQQLIENGRTCGLLGADPVKGYKDVTYGDANMEKYGKQARRRVEEPCFDKVIFMRDKSTLVIYDNIRQVVDRYLLIPRDRDIDLSNAIRPSEVRVRGIGLGGMATASAPGNVVRPREWQHQGRHTPPRPDPVDEAAQQQQQPARDVRTGRATIQHPRVLRALLFGIDRTLVTRIARDLDVTVEVVGSADAADALLCLRSKQEHGAAPIEAARRAGLEIRLLDANSATAVRGALRDLFGIHGRSVAI